MLHFIAKNDNTKFSLYIPKIYISIDVQNEIFYVRFKTSSNYLGKSLNFKFQKFSNELHIIKGYLNHKNFKAFSVLKGN